MVKKIFSLSERRVISAMYQLDRWATVNEIANWADGMSWNTAKKVLRKLYRKKIVQPKRMNGKRHWRIVK